jgi:hypothetical protein
MSTLLSDLDSAPAQGDGDFVQNILNEMNGVGGQQQAPSPVQGPPAVGGFNQGVINAPNPNTIAPRQMDSGPATAHMIGNSHPTPADFTQMMNSSGAGASPAAAPQGDQWGASYTAQQPRAAPPPAPKRSWLTRIIDDFRIAFFVAIVVFVFSLPVVNFLFAHYIPSMVKSTGELTLLGLLIKSFVAGSTFWVIQRVIVPLLTL